MNTATLDQVRRAWAEVLDVDTVPDDVNFFEVGGDSLLLLVLLERLNGMTELDLDVADLFQHSTVQSQAEQLTSSGANRDLLELGATNRHGLLSRARQGK